MLKEIFFRVPKDKVEAFSDELIEMGALSVTVECLEGSDIIKDEASFEAQYWDENRLSVLIQQEDEIRFSKLFFEDSKAVPEIDWVLQMQRNTPIQIIHNQLWIVPSWHQVPKEAKTVLLLDPKNAFGTGDHPTTHLCLQWLIEHPLRDKSIIDYGCGSGILMIAAKKLGAHKIQGFDIDANSMLVAKQNCVENGIEPDFDLDGTEGDIVLANIHLGPLLSLVNTLKGLLRQKGILVLSGILPFQLPKLLESYLPHFELVSVDTQNGWMRVVLKKG